MKIDIDKLLEYVDISNDVKPNETYKGTFLSEKDIKELRIEAKKIKEAYIRSARRARNTYVK